MNYITSCPACETQFLLNKEHLKAHRGKVQCGHCEHIFNAKNRLTEVSDDIHSAAEYNASLDNEFSVDNNDIASADSLEPPPLAEPTFVIEEKPISEMLNGVLDSVPNLSNLESVAPSINEPYIDDYVPVIETFDDADELADPIVIEDLSSDPKFTKNKFKAKNLLLPLFGILLITLAALQTIYFSRTQISAQYPQFKPYLTQACQALQCEINLPKNVDLLTIDDSDMQESDDFQDVINFSSLLINNANHVQAYPNIELTLTDTQDQPVLRRLVTPSEYLAANTKVDIGIEARQEVRINLAINASNLPVAGYRVLLVY